MSSRWESHARLNFNSDIDIKILFSKVDSPEKATLDVQQKQNTPQVACVQGESTLENSIFISISELKLVLARCQRRSSIARRFLIFVYWSI